MIQQFINYIEHVRGLSPLTCNEYHKNLICFARWASCQGLRWSTITKQDIDRWTAQQSEAGIMPATIKARMSALRTFYWYLVHEDRLAKNPAQYCSTPKKAKTLPMPADVSKIDTYLQQPVYNMRDRHMHLMTAIMLETGIRISEALNLEQKDFCTTDQSIRITGKGNKQRIVYYGKRTKEAIAKYTCAMTNKLFPGYDAMTARYDMYATLGTICERIHPHTLRATFACTCLDKGMGIKEVSQLMGHTHTSSTDIYAKVSDSTLHNHYQQIFN